jgi:hypothetical protein
MGIICNNTFIYNQENFITINQVLKNMKKTIIYLAIIIAVVSTCFVTSATATLGPTITGIRGGYGVTATVTGARGHDWYINISGPNIIYGIKTNGSISSSRATIRTPIYPPAFGFGKIFIKVTIDRSLFPDIIEERTAYMLGPFVLFVRNIPS